MARSDKENKKFDSKFRVRVVNGSGKLVSGDINESNPVANIVYVNTLPSEITYNMADGTTQTVTIGRDSDNNPIVNGVTYNRHVVDIPSGTIRYGEPPKTPPAIVDIILSGDIIGDDAPINAVIGTLTGVGGTPPIGFQLVSGSPFVKVVGTELRVASDLSAAPSQITIEILAQDTTNEQFSKQFSVSVIASPAITDITLSNNEFTDADPAARTALAYGDDLRIFGTTSGSFDFRIRGAAFKFSIFDNGSKAYICTEVVAQALKTMGYTVPHPERLTVYDVYKQCHTLKSLEGD